MGLRMDDIHAPTVASGPTSTSSGDGTSSSQTFRELVRQKENLEAELSALSSVLDSHGVNMNTSLLTFDGFPRSDIDVAQIRTTRAQIIRLKNDYKAVMAKLEVAIQQQFAAGKAGDVTTRAANPGGSLPTTTSNATAAASSSSSASAAIEPPFATVNTVSPGSPATQAGMQVGDKVVRFGSCNWTNHERLTKVAQVVQENENRTIPTYV